MLRKVVVLACLLVLISSDVLADELDDTPSIQTLPDDLTLMDLPGVFLLLDVPEKTYLRNPAQATTEQVGLSEEAIRADVESRLLQNGIKTFSEEEWLSTQRRPHLHIRMSLACASRCGHCAYKIDLSLSQRVYIDMGDTRLEVPRAQTWNPPSYFFIVDVENLSSLREDVLSLVDQFVLGYHRANPKE